VSDGRVLHFPIGARRFAVPVTGILEIREVPEPTPVPGSPSVVAGLVEIRGRIVTLVDLARVFGLEERSGGELLAVQFAEPLGHLGLLVADSAHNVETDPATVDAWTEDETNPREASSAGSASPNPDERGLGSGSDAGWITTEDVLSLGREIVLSGARPALLLDPAALADFCTRRVRDRFRVSG